MNHIANISSTLFKPIILYLRILQLLYIDVIISLIRLVKFFTFLVLYYSILFIRYFCVNISKKTYDMSIYLAYLHESIHVAEISEILIFFEHDSIHTVKDNKIGFLAIWIGSLVVLCFMIRFINGCHLNHDPNHDPYFSQFLHNLFFTLFYTIFARCKRLGR
jgi:hypothetical protein